MPEYNIYFDICAVILSIVTLFIYASRNDKGSLQHRLFLYVLLVELVTELADIASVAARPQGGAGPLIAYGSHYLYLLAHALPPVLITCYVLVVTGVSKKHSHTLLDVCVWPYALIVAAMALNAAFHWVFYLDESGAYRHGPLILLLYAFAFAYTAADIVLIIRFRASIPNRREIPLMAFLLVALGAAAFQYFHPHLLIETFMQATVTLWILVTIEAPTDMYSTVTGVYNRKAFMMENMSSMKSGQGYKVIIVKLLNARYYMATLGYMFMQDMLYNVARYLVHISDETCVYDCDNGTFAMVLYGSMQHKTAEIVEQARAKFAQDWLRQDMAVSFKTQICIVDIPGDVDTLDHLAALVDTSESKSESRVSIIQKEQLAYLRRRTLVENAIEKALRSGGFKVYYQPIWDCHTNKIHSAEALVRLIDDELGFIPPDEFIPIAEKNGTVTAIGQFVFEETCQMFSRERLADMGLDFIEVNLSTVQCMHKALPDIFKNTLDHYSMEARSINLEITESAAINSQETFHQTIRALRTMGFSFSLDDYGTGYSNASYIFNMDFNIIKIDKSILWGAEKNSSGKIIFENTVRMIKEMKKKILVEGVETEAQKDLVTGMGCDYCQGYYFSKPVPREQFIEYCRAFNAAHQR